MATKKKAKTRSTTKAVNKANATAAKTTSLLKNASASAKLDTSNPFGFITDNATIQSALDAATNAAYDVEAREANLGLNRAESSAQNNIQNTANALRGQLATSNASGGNVGAANATALQAILGLGQQNNALVTEGLQGVQGVAGKRSSALAGNAATALEQSNAARGQQATAANEKYTADQTRSAEALSSAGALAGTVHTNQVNRAMNDDTNTANKKIANTTQKQKVTQVTKNTNINKNK